VTTSNNGLSSWFSLAPQVISFVIAKGWICLSFIISIRLYGLIVRWMSIIWLQMKIIKWHWKGKKNHHTWQPYDKPYADHDVNKTTIDVFNIIVISNITTLFLPSKISFIWLNLQIKGYFENEIQMQPCSLEIGSIWLFSYNIMFKNIF
jgi:hypothetical protein